MEKLADEVRQNQQAQQMVDSLQYYLKKHSVDGVDGLEAKLDHAQMGARKLDAIRKKELFGKLLEEKSFYASAQEIFAYLLSSVETNFNTYVYPSIGNVTLEQLDILVKEKVADPVLADIGGAAFMINYNHVLGMVYWLAEQCFVRWHK